MGLLVDGVWQQDGVRTKDGQFIRPTTAFPQLGDARRQRRALPAKAALPPKPAAITSTSRSPAPGRTAPSSSASSRAWRTSSPCRPSRPTCSRTAGPSTRTKARAATQVNGKSKLSEIYLLADPKYSGRVSVPVLWDKKRKTIVNNELPEIIRMLNSAFDAFTNVHTDYYPRDAARRDRPRSTTCLSEHQQRRLSRRLRHLAGGLRGGVPQRVRHARRDRAAAVAASLSRRQRHHRGRLAAVLHADPFRRRLLFALQVQLAAHLRISQSVELRARSLPGAGRGRDREPRSRSSGTITAASAR